MPGRTVALLAEGVDRNSCMSAMLSPRLSVALLAEGVDRNWSLTYCPTVMPLSPSSRRAWIEIIAVVKAQHGHRSPSSRRAWIEIQCFQSNRFGTKSRPPRGGRG